MRINRTCIATRWPLFGTSSENIVDFHVSPKQENDGAFDDCAQAQEPGKGDAAADAVRTHTHKLKRSGLDNAGKTTVLARIAGDGLVEAAPTLGFAIRSVDHLDRRISVWDVGGQRSIRSYWRNYFEATDGLVWVVDAADRSDRLLDAKAELHSLLMEERLAGASLLILANKQDLASALSFEEIAEILDLASIKTHHWHIEGCSAVTGANLLNGMTWIVKDISSRIFSLD